MTVKRIPLLAPLLAQGKALHRAFQAVVAISHRYPRSLAVATHPILLTSAVITGLLLGAKQMAWLEPLELLAYDQFVNLHPQQEFDPRLLIVGITDADIRSLKQWPLSDQVLAQTLEELQGHQPRVIGLDLYREIPYPPGQAALQSQLSADNVVVIESYGAVPPPPGVPPERVGFNDVVTDADGVVRRHFMFTTVDDQEFYAFGLRLSLQYLAESGVTFQASPQQLQIGETQLRPLTPSAGGYRTIDALGYQTLLRYRSATAVARQVTLTQLLAGEVPAHWINDKVILIGSTAASTKDMFLTPYTRTDRQQATTPGVEIHAQMVSQLLTAVETGGDSLFGYWPDSYEGVWMWVWAVVGGGLAWRIKRPLALGGVGLGVVAGLWGLHLILFVQAVWVPAIAPILSCIATGMGVVTYKRFHHMWHDPITQLANRERFIVDLTQQLNHAERAPDKRFAVLLIRLDRLGLIHASMGRQTGNQILLEIVKRWRSCLRGDTYLARISDEEFALLLMGIANVQDAIQVAEQLQAQLAPPVEAIGKPLYLNNMNVGIALSQPGHIHHPEQLLQDANAAMYCAKARGQTRYEVFSEGLREQALYDVELEAELRQALEHREFFLTYQPIICLKTGEIAGFEALIRWQHPQHGLVSPGKFIAIAEQSGLIIPIGQWAFERACQQLNAWQTLFSDQTPLIMSVNLSIKQLAQPDLVEQFARILEETGVDGEHVKLEITESMMMDNLKEVQPILLKLKSLGLQLSMDDFGTGYSSLSYLPRLPMDNLKIDRSFVSRMHETSEDAEIVNMIVMLSHHLGLDVVAEGIEEREQISYLQGLGCDYGQGYFFAKPLPSKAATEFLLKNETHRWFPETPSQEPHTDLNTETTVDLDLFREQPVPSTKQTLEVH